MRPDRTGNANLMHYKSEFDAVKRTAIHRMVASYIHLLPDWPKFRWDQTAFDAKLAAFHQRRGALLALMATLGFKTRQETVLKVLVEDFTKSSEIEGERLDAVQVRSSIARRLGMNFAGLPVPARHIDGVVEMMLDATQRFDVPLTDERIFGWHSAFFPDGRSGLRKILVGGWRDDHFGPMQVVSGPIGKHIVHFEAPAAVRLNDEMPRFLTWVEKHSMDPVLKAALAHLWFVTLHPMDDGNGRIGRAIMDMALARADQTNQRFYSVTAEIHRRRDGYYDILEQTQRRSMDVTPWMDWFLDRMSEALSSAEGVLETVHRKQLFWDTYRDLALNDRQTKILNLLFEGFEGKLQTAKYAKLAKCSNDTALRDLTDLVQHGILQREAGGRSTSYTPTPLFSRAASN